MNRSLFFILIFVLTLLVSGSSRVYAQTDSAKGQTDSTKGQTGSVKTQTDSSKTKTLQAVIINGKKPMIERQPGKTVLNVDGSILGAGSSVFEILERAPDVSIDQSDNIKLKGKAGVLILIDGKPSPIAGTDLTNMLKALPAGAVDKIELISNPDARYDAAGNGGVINIKLKKNQQMGANGSVNFSYGQGVYAKTNAGFTFNYRHGKMNIFGSYNYSYRKTFSNPNLYRIFLNGDTVLGAFKQNDRVVFPFHTHMERIGVDYSLSSKTVIGMVVNGLQNRYNWKGDNYTDVLDGNLEKVSDFQTQSHSENQYNNYSVNGNFKHSFDSSGTELTADLDYARYSNSSHQTFITDYFNNDGSPMSPQYILFGTLPGTLSIKSLKADYTRPAGKHSKWDAGLKSSYVVSDNDITFYDKSNGITTYDSTKSNHFIYKEQINAGYFTFHREQNRIAYDLGLRLEQTRIKGHQLVSDQRVDTSYLQMFPSLSLRYKASADHQFSFSANRRIERPSYKQLNPFKFYIDPTTYVQGNPLLRPQTTYNLEFSHTFKGMLTTTLSYSTTHDNITEVLAPSTVENKVTIQTDKNLERVRYYVGSVSLSLQVTKWWNTLSDGSVYYGSYQGNLSNTPLNNGNVTFNLNSNNTLVMGKGYSGEVNFTYHAAEVYGFYYINPNWQMTTGVQKNILHDKGSLKCTVTDLFYTNITKGHTSFNGYYESFVTKRDTRVATLSFTYRFGNKKLDPARRMNGGAETEKSRAIVN
ncbi:TonB-dependent receptor domain-containing protein [Flavitalea flava]